MITAILSRKDVAIAAVEVGKCTSSFAMLIDPKVFDQDPGTGDIRAGLCVRDWLPSQGGFDLAQRGSGLFLKGTT